MTADRPRRRRAPRRRRRRLAVTPPDRRPAVVAHAPSSTRSTCAASPTATATAPATWPASASRLPYLRDLGVDAIWFTPWYAVAAGRRRLRRRRLPRHRPASSARSRRPRRSSPRPWRSASAPSSTSSPTTSPTSTRGSRRRSPPAPARPERERFWFRPGKGANGDEMPTALALELRGHDLDAHDQPRRHARRVVPAPVRARAARPQLEPPRRAARARGHPAVLVRPGRRRRAHRLRGAAGQGRRACPRCRRATRRRGPGQHPNDGPRRAARHLPRLARGRRLATPARASSSARSGCPTSTRFALYLRPDELHTAFNFDFLARPWDAGALRESIDRTLAAHAPVGAPATWVLSNHDVTRPVTRYGREDTLVRVPGQALRHADRPRARPPAGPRRRAARRRAARLALHLPGRRARACPRSRTCRPS